MTSAQRKTLLRYLLAVSLCLLALLLRWALIPLLGDSGPFLTLFPTIVVASLLCGTGPGIVATLLSSLSANLILFETETFSETPVSSPVASNISFLAVGILINWMASTRFPIRTLIGEPAAMAEIRAEASLRVLRETEDRLRMAEQVSGYGTWDWNLRTGEADWSDGVFKLFGEEPGSAAPRTIWRKALRPGYVEASEAEIKRALSENREDLYFEAEFLRRDGARRWVAMRGRVLYGADGRAERMLGINFDITERRESEIRLDELNKQLRKSLGQIKAIFEIAPVGIAFAEDPKCNVITANRTLAQMVGVRPDDNVSINGENGGALPYKHMKNGRELTQWELPMQRAVAEKRPILDEEIEIVRADGRTLTIQAFASPIFDADGNVIGCVSAQVDVTERKKLLTELERQFANEKLLRRQAEDASKVKDEFLATVSHELRTPLNSIGGWTTILMQADVPQETVRRGLNAIESATRAQTRLIGDLLDISKIISGGFTVEQEPVELIPVVISAAETLRPLAEEKGVEIVVEADGVFEGVAGDPCRLEQVLINLVHNAVKFSYDGGRIDVGLRRDAGEAVIEVTDRGRGIGPGFLPFVFERFRQEDDSIAKSFSGLGLGLAIAKRLVELHGGTISASSEGEGKGATFTVRLPMTGAVAAYGTGKGLSKGREPMSVSAPEGELTGMKVLVVDDDDDSREILKIVLEQSGATVISAGSSIDGLAEFSASRPDVVISDIGMPGEDGYSFIRKLRELDGGGPGVVAVAVTAFARSEDRGKALTNGFDDHLSKPVEPAELVRVIVSLTRR